MNSREENISISKKVFPPLNVVRSGERFLPHDATPNEVMFNLERYVFAAGCVADKVICDIGFGSGLGTYLYSLTAKQIYAYDYSDEAFLEKEKYPFRENIEFIKQNLEKDFRLNDCEAIIALEVLEHLENPIEFLKAQMAREIIFSLPHWSLANSTWHKFDIRSQQDVENMFVAGGYKVSSVNNQYNHWFYGVAAKFN